MFAKSSVKNSMMKKRIPTIVGLLVLLGALISGLLFFGDGTGVFAPRATAETMPKNIRITNLTDSGFTVTFLTEKATSGFVKYGTDPAKLNSQVSDDRDQLSGTVEDYNLHHITVRGLESAREYFFILGTDSKTEYDNEGEPFSIKIPAKISSQMPPAITVYGSISREGGTPADGSIVYLSSEQMGDLSALVKGSGSWAVPLSQSLNKEGTDYAGLEEADFLELLVQGEKITDKIKYQTTVADAQPVEELTFGQVYEQASQDDLETGVDEVEPDTDQASQEAQLTEPEQEDQEEATISGRLLELLDDADPLPTESTASSELILGEASAEPRVTNPSPEIIGAAKPNVEVKISVHSETNYETTLTTDDDGSFKLSLEELGLELEPGEHTVTYSYLDPDSGEEVTVTETFLVEDPDKVLLAQASSPSPTVVVTSSPTPSPTSQPYGSGSPYPMNVPTPIPTLPTATNATTATESTSATRKQPVGTDSSLTEAGSIGATLLVALAGGFFILMGSWSWWLATELEEE